MSGGKHWQSLRGRRPRRRIVKYLGLIHEKTPGDVVTGIRAVRWFYQQGVVGLEMRLQTLVAA